MKRLALHGLGVSLAVLYAGGVAIDWVLRRRGIEFP